jgi:hypothetical protein
MLIMIVTIKDSHYHLSSPHGGIVAVILGIVAVVMGHHSDWPAMTALVCSTTTSRKLAAYPSHFGACGVSTRHSRIALCDKEHCGDIDQIGRFEHWADYG